MADFSAIRAGLAGLVDNVSGLKVYTTFPEQVLTPCAIVQPVAWQYRQAIGNVNHSQWDVIVLAAPIDNGFAKAQNKLDGYLDDTGDDSIKARIEADKTLGGTVATTVVTGVRQYGSIEVGTKEFAGAIIEVEAWT